MTNYYSEEQVNKILAQPLRYYTHREKPIKIDHDERLIRMNKLQASEVKDLIDDRITKLKLSSSDEDFKHRYQHYLTDLRKLFE